MVEAKNRANGKFLSKKFFTNVKRVVESPSQTFYGTPYVGLLVNNNSLY